ncbi:hypothetical protein LCGC14_2317840, partial [marine sediment metagenome]
EGLQLSSVGSNVFEFTCNTTTTGNLVFLNAVTATNFEITLLSVKDADTDWTKGAGWIVAGGKATWDGTQGSPSTLNQAEAFDDGDALLYKFTISNYSVGQIRVRGDVNSNWLDGNGTKVILLTTGGVYDNIALQADSDFIGSIDNVSVHKLTFQKEIAESTNYTGTHYVLPYDENDFIIPVDYVAEGIVAQVFGGETNATAGFVAANNAIVSSVGSPIQTGSYAMKIESNTTPTPSADVQEDYTIEDDEVYRIDAWIRHIGVGLTWNYNIDPGGGASTVKQFNISDTTYQNIIYYVTAIGTNLNFRFREGNASNNGGLYFDNISIKKVTFI